MIIFRGVRLAACVFGSRLDGEKSYKIGSKSNKIWAKPRRDFLYLERPIGRKLFKN